VSERIKVNFDNFELEEKRLLIRLFRLSRPATVQRDWEAFCLRHALPLSRTASNDPLKEDEVLLTRRRVDRLFLWGAVFALPAGVASAWQLDRPDCLLFPLAPLAIGLVMRLTIPRLGIRCRKLSAKPDRRLVSFLWFLLAWAIVGIAALLLLPNTSPWVDWGAFTLWLGVLLFQCHRLDRRIGPTQQATQRARALLATEEWERLEGLRSGSNGAIV
jgi:hypothetical protein